MKGDFLTNCVTPEQIRDENLLQTESDRKDI